ncbi:16S rRNA (cytidine(1402)-2'-O)-methyltransferase [Thioclava pacifica]|nr:16S rRNA (cytidine(1402)-2'-O)-methyltransferase [Thioclava pacifica]
MPSGEVQTRGNGGLAPGLYFIATPIGAARDITLHALDLLRSADVLAAEDTRSLRHLMEIHGVSLAGRPLLAYHDHNGAAMRPKILRAIEEGRSVVYASEAGTPLVADPGYQLARSVIEAGFALHSAPGPSAVLTALTLSGLPSDRFLFAGFAPNTRGARRNWLAEFKPIPATLVFYESPKRIREMLGDCVQVFGGERQAALCRELTKRFEEVRRGSLSEISQSLAEAPVKGEIVLVIDRAHAVEIGEEELEARLREVMAQASLRDAVDEVVAQTGLPRRKVYQAALALEKEQ